MKLKRHRQSLRKNDKHDTFLEGSKHAWWFKTAGNNPIHAPPLLHPSCKLQVGDIFYHQNSVKPQFWIRDRDEGSEEGCWRSIDLGYEREDGRKLTLTEKYRDPSWVGGDWGIKRVAACECDLPEL